MAVLFLRSNNLHDIQASVNNGGWTHTCKSRRVQVNDTVIVFGNKKVCKESGIPFEKQMALVGRLVRKPYNLTEEDANWPSNVTGTKNKYYARFDLTSMDLVSLDMIPGAIDAVAYDNTHMSGGKYVS